MNRLTKFLVGAVSFAALAFIVTAAIAYQRGVYDITFIERPVTETTDSEKENETTDVTDTSDTETTAVETTAADSTSADATADSTDSQTEDADIDPPPEAVEYTVKDFIDSLGSTSLLSAEGYYITDLVYGEGSTLALLTPETTPGTEYSLSERTVEVPVRIPDETYSGYTTEIKEQSEKRPLVDIYMDYLIIDKGGSYDLLNRDGTLLIEDFDLETYVPAYTRDRTDNPLFITREPSRYNPRNTITKYYYINSKGDLKVNQYNDKTDNRGLYFNYPSYYGRPEEEYTIFYNSDLKLYGYGNNVGVESEEDYRYIAAFHHSEGLCAAVETDGLMYYLNRSLDTHLSAQIEFYKSYGNTQRRLLRNFILPDTFGIESLGFFYFDHGLCRVRAQTIDAWHWQQYERKFVNADEDILIRTDGSEFPIPTDYKLVSYSNGILLLEKNGSYGYMDYKGKWITKPIYTYAQPFFEGLAAVGNDGAVGMIDTSGNFVIPQVFDYVSSASGGLVTAYSGENGWYVFNKMNAPEK